MTSNGRQNRPLAEKAAVLALTALMLVGGFAALHWMALVSASMAATAPATEQQLSVKGVNLFSIMAGGSVLAMMAFGLYCGLAYAFAPQRGLAQKETDDLQRPSIAPIKQQRLFSKAIRCSNPK